MKSKLDTYMESQLQGARLAVADMEGTSRVGIQKALNKIHALMQEHATLVSIGKTMLAKLQAGLNALNDGDAEHDITDDVLALIQDIAHEAESMLPEDMAGKYKFVCFQDARPDSKDILVDWEPVK